MLSEIPCINNDLPPDTKEALMCKNKITDHVIKNLPSGNVGIISNTKKDEINLKFERTCNKKIRADNLN